MSRAKKLLIEYGGDAGGFRYTPPNGSEPIEILGILEAVILHLRTTMRLRFIAEIQQQEKAAMEEATSKEGAATVPGSTPPNNDQ